MGHKICVKYFGKDPVNGKHRISRKALLNIPPPMEGAKGQQGNDQLLAEALEGGNPTEQSSPPSQSSRKTDH